MDKNQNIEEPELRWIETPKGRGIINAVSLTTLLAITQHFGVLEPGPPVRLENMIQWGIMGIVVGLLMYVWTDFRLRRRRKKLEAATHNATKDKSEDE